MTYRDEQPACARCGKVITSQIAITVPWAPFAVMCGSLGDPHCFAQAEADLKRTYGVPTQVTKRVIDSWPWFAFGVVLAGIAGFLLYAIASTILADARIEGCYTWPASTGGLLTPPQWQLYGRIDWRDDKLLGTFYSFDDAVNAANKLHCPIYVKAPQ